MQEVGNLLAQQHHPRALPDQIPHANIARIAGASGLNRSHLSSSGFSALRPPGTTPVQGGAESIRLLATLQWPLTNRGRFRRIAGASDENSATAWCSVDRFWLPFLSWEAPATTAA